MEQKQDFKIGDAVLGLEEVPYCPFWLVSRIEPDNSGASWISLQNLDPKSSCQITSYPLMYMEKKFVKINESTVKILFGASYGKIREKIQKPSSDSDSVRNQAK